MRVLLDECVNRGPKSAFVRSEASHVSDVGLDTLKNGAPLREANERFDVMVTIDRNMPFQSSLRGMSLAVMVLRARSNSLPELRRFFPQAEDLLTTLVPGTFTVVERPAGR